MYIFRETSYKVGCFVLARKYCPICYFEFDEKVGLETNGKVKPMDYDPNAFDSKPDYKCSKRGHFSKGSGLSVAELEKLIEFRKLKI